MTLPIGTIHPAYASPRLMSSRMASDRVWPLAFAHLSRLAISVLGKRRPIMGWRPPVAQDRCQTPPGVKMQWHE